MKRLLSCAASDFKKMSSQDLKWAIQASECRTILGETVVTTAPLIEGITNAEMMAAFGADLVVLNEFDVFNKDIVGMKATDNPIAQIKKWIGRPVGINLEPVDKEQTIPGETIQLSPGRQATEETFKVATELGIDFIMLTGNPSTGVSMPSIEEAIITAKEHFTGLIFAGKMHGAGLAENIIDIEQLSRFIKNGADGVLIPACGTVPGVIESDAHLAAKAIHQLGGLVMATIGTSQESADEATMREIGLSNKRVGADIHHIGDGGYGRMPLPENITQLSVTVRGKRHTYFRMAQSINR